MVLAGLGFGGHRPDGGVVLVSLSQNLPEGPQVRAAAIRDLGFAGMGAALLGVHAPRGRSAAAYPG